MYENKPTQDYERASAMHPVSQSQVSNEIMQLQNSIESLGKALEELNARLSPVLRDDATMARESEKIVNAPMVALALNIRDKRLMVARNVELVAGMISRLEL